MSRPIEDYGLIADGRSAALVSRDASIDWLCWPRFDADACFAALVGTAEHGHWSLRPERGASRCERCYEPDTLVLQTDFHTPDGAVRVTDFMPPTTHGDAPSLVRIVGGLRGTVTMRSTLAPRFDYGARVPSFARERDALVARAGPSSVALYTDVPADIRERAIVSTFEIHAGERRSFTLRYGDDAGPIDVERELDRTRGDWRDWIRAFDDRRTPWPDAVRRSLLVLRALIYRPTGAMVAAPTTSLPEVPGGSMNWDYRYCWLRDASFALDALLDAGFHHEARAWRDWLLRAIGGTPERIRILYRVDGSVVNRERCIDALPGWNGARPVRVGNAATEQRQLDVFGEVMDCLHVVRAAGSGASPEEVELERRIVEHLERNWRKPASGIWEIRSARRQYTLARVMVWVALDRFLMHASAPSRPRQADDDLIERARALHATIHREVCENAWSDTRGAFTRAEGSDELDASLLLMPLVGFLPIDDERVRATVDAIGRELGDGGLIRRLPRGKEGPHEGTFIACSCWMADCLLMLGRDRDARALFERVLGMANDLGLLAEEYDVDDKQLAGNFPQALSHLALVQTALRFDHPHRTRR
ncbi:MAG TPA: glycoside hydrolase family 15 protein [Paraburkholderia sp.]|jgi:GH15 family glucan-1,4-alpha-glucosidase|nr:glycoside hydrolase family 15 protein [Paraburkholderia sp.]